jgi:ribosomal protein S18 acetylase RimI-like enzyme
MVKIKKMKAADRDAMYQLLQQNDALTAKEIELEISRIDSALFKTTKDKIWVQVAHSAELNLVGYGMYGVEPMTRRTFQIYRILISPLCKNQGIEEMILSSIEEDIRKKQGQLLITQVSSASRYKSMRKFFLAHNFSLKSQIKNYYENGVDQIFYTKVITDFHHTMDEYIR